MQSFEAHFRERDHAYEPNATDSLKDLSGASLPSNFSDSVTGTSAEVHEGGALMVLRRSEQPAFFRTLTSLLQTQMSLNFQEKGTAEKLAGKLERFVFRLQRKAAVEEFSAAAASEWVSDMKGLISGYSVLTGAKSIELRLATMIPRNSPFNFAGEGFHLDRKRDRLLTWYSGSTFEWVERGSIDQSGFQRYSRSGIANDFISSTTKIHSLHTGDVAFFDGTTLVHRSPVSPDIRLLFFIDRCD